MVGGECGLCESATHGGDDDALDVLRGPSHLRVGGIACPFGFLEARHLEFGGVVARLAVAYYQANEAGAGVGVGLWMRHKDMGVGQGVEYVAVVVHETGVEELGFRDLWHLRRARCCEGGLKPSTVRWGMRSMSDGCVRNRRARRSRRSNTYFVVADVRLHTNIFKPADLRQLHTGRSTDEGVHRLGDALQ